ncbi:hypothetical protein Esti_001850 [Eimeria stiedai]
MAAGKWEDHEVFAETAAERRALGLSTGDAFRPLSEAGDLQAFMHEDLLHPRSPLRLHPTANNRTTKLQQQQQQEQRGQHRRTTTPSPRAGQTEGTRTQQPRSKSQVCMRKTEVWGFSRYTYSSSVPFLLGTACDMVCACTLIPPYPTCTDEGRGRAGLRESGGDRERAVGGRGKEERQLLDIIQREK